MALYVTRHIKGWDMYKCKNFRKIIFLSMPSSNPIWLKQLHRNNKVTVVSIFFCTRNRQALQKPGICLKIENPNY